MVVPSGAGIWRETKELARQDAIRAGFGYRDPDSGTAFLDPAVWIESESDVAESDPIDLMEGDALAVLIVHGRNAEAFASRQREISAKAEDRARWSNIIEKVQALRTEARLAATCGHSSAARGDS